MNPSPPGSTATIREALEHAIRFIENGVALGFIRMPDPDVPDPAHLCLPNLKAALASLNPEAAPVPAAMPQIEVGDD